MTDRPGEGYIQRQLDWARSYFGARSGEPIHELAPELALALILENDRPETMVLQHTFPWSSGRVSIAGAVAHVNQLQIINPANSGLLVVVQGMKITGKPSAGAVRISIDGLLLAAGQAPNLSLDTRARLVAAQRVVASLNAVDNATVSVNGYIIDEFFVPITTDGQSPVVASRPIILTPGNVAGIWNTTLNEASLFVAWGYERPLDSTELVNR